MNQHTTNLMVLGLSIDFKASVDMRRVEEAVHLVEERFHEQMLRFPKGQTKDILLTFMALGLADDLLQLQKEMAEAKNRLNAILARIESSV